MAFKEKSVVYARVSSREQEETGYSLPAQEKLLQDYAARKELEIARIFSVAESASGSKQRKIFAEMIEYMTRENVPHLLCEKVDRLTRNLKEAVTASDWVEEDENRHIHFVKQNLVISKNSRSDDRFRWDIEIVLAKKYIANLSEEVKKGQKEKIAQGWLPCRPPLGYKTIGEKGHKTHVTDESAAPLIRKMFELYATGEYPLSRLYKTMRDMGLRTHGGYVLARSRIAELLADPFYCGMIRWNGVVYQGKQPPLISKDLFDRVQQIIHGRGTAKYRKHIHLFKGLTHCHDCGGLITWEEKKGHVYGHCSSYRNCVKRSWYREEDFERLVANEFGRLQLASPRLAEWVRKALRELHSSEIASSEAAIEGIRDNQTRLRQRKDMLYTDRLDGRITAAEYDEKNAAIEKELQSLEEAFQRHLTADKRYYELGINIFELSQRAAMIFSKAPIEKKRRLLTLVCKELYIEDGKLHVVFSEAFYTLARLLEGLESSKTPDKLVSPIKIFELTKSPYFSSPNGVPDVNFRAELRRQDSNL